MTPPSQPADSPRRASGLRDEYSPEFVSGSFSRAALIAEARRRGPQGIERRAAYPSGATLQQLHDTALLAVVAAALAEELAAPVPLPEGAGEPTRKLRQVQPHTVGPGYLCTACAKPHVPGCIRDRDPSALCPGSGHGE